MSKRRRPANPQIEEEVPVTSEVAVPDEFVDVDEGQALANIRTKALNAQADIARVIGELEERRAEIEMTLAYLKAMRK